MKNKIQKNIDKLLNVWSKCQELFSLVRFIVIIIAVIIALICVAIKNAEIRKIIKDYNLLPQSLTQFFFDNAELVLVVLQVVLIMVLIISIVRVGKKKIDANAKIYNCINKLHEELSQKLQEGIYNLLEAKERVDVLIVKDNEEAIKEMQKQAFHEMKVNLQAFVDIIAEFLSDYRGDVISVCIKTINSGQNSVRNEDKQARTLVRSKNTRKSRNKENENITLGLNSDFKYLCNGTSLYYCGVDLKSLFDERKYENEADSRDWQKKYNSTIVLPIRYCVNEETQYVNDIIGFLCIDSKRIVRCWEESDALEIQFLSLFAELIYIYIKLFGMIFEKGKD